MRKQHRKASNPFNLVRKLRVAFKDVLAHLTMSLDADRELAYRVLAGQLEDRITSAMDKSVFADSINYPRLVEFDPKDPMETAFKVENTLYTLRELPSVYDTPELRLKGRAGIVQDIKAGYISWLKDYAKDLDLLNKGSGKTKGNKRTFLYMMGKIRTYKLLWRLLSTAANFAAVAVILQEISGIFYNLSKFGTMSYMVSNSQLTGTLLTLTMPVLAYKILKLVESAFSKRKVNIDKFDSISKTSAEFPEVNRFLVSHEERGLAKQAKVFDFLTGKIDLGEVEDLLKNHHKKANVDVRSVNDIQLSFKARKRTYFFKGHISQNKEKVRSASLSSILFGRHLRNNLSRGMNPRDKNSVIIEFLPNYNKMGIAPVKGLRPLRVYVNPSQKSVHSDFRDDIRMKLSLDRLNQAFYSAEFRLSNPSPSPRH